MKNLEFLTQEIKDKVSPLINYLDQYYSYNESKSNDEKVIYYGDETNFVILNPSNEELIISYSNEKAVSFASKQYPFVKAEENKLIFNYKKPLPYILIYVTFDKCLDI